MREKEFLPLVESRLGITQLNDMQTKMMATASNPNDIILLSPTGSGKTLAFILPMLKRLNPPTGRVQAIIIAPSRELVLQIAGIIREIATGFKTTPLYGGHKVEDELNSLKQTPDIIVATPGRLLDHINRRNFDPMPTRILILDEFDKSLELGFEEEMKKIFKHLKNISRRILTSATNLQILPDFITLNNTITLSFLQHNQDLRKRLQVIRVNSDGKDKLSSLLSLLHNITPDNFHISRTIIFVNHRESAIRVAEFLHKNNADVAIYHGALEQMDREKAISLFNNGSSPILVATDLAARGLDIDTVENIIHYHQPISVETYTHRNGRTARVDASGSIYVIVGPEENVADFISFDRTFYLNTATHYKNLKSDMTSLYISAGKKEKISRGDIVGFLIAQGGLSADKIGKIDVRDHYSLVAIPKSIVKEILPLLQTAKIKGTRRRILVTSSIK